MHRMQKFKKPQVATSGVKNPYHDVFGPFQVNPTKQRQFPWDRQQGGGLEPPERPQGTL